MQWTQIIFLCANNLWFGILCLYRFSQQEPLKSVSVNVHTPPSVFQHTLAFSQEVLQTHLACPYLRPGISRSSMASWFLFYLNNNKIFKKNLGTIYGYGDCNIFYLIFISSSLKGMVSLLLEREESRERNINERDAWIASLPCVPRPWIRCTHRGRPRPDQGQSRNLSVCPDRQSNRQSFGYRSALQRAGSRPPGLFVLLNFHVILVKQARIPYMYKYVSLYICVYIHTQ